MVCSGCMSELISAVTFPSAAFTESAKVAGPLAPSAVIVQSPRNAAAFSAVAAFAGAAAGAAGAAVWAGAAAGAWAWANGVAIAAGTSARTNRGEATQRRNIIKPPDHTV